ANYSSGNLAVLSFSSNGGIDSVVQNIQHHGHGMVSPNQDHAHVHCAVMSPVSNVLFVTDLGLDKIFSYNYNEKTGKLSPGNPATYSVTKGSGPRMMTFSPDGKYLYLIQELGGQITVFGYDSGKLTKVQEISNLPEGYDGRIWAADIHFSPDGAFLYATNRDDLNDIVTYKVNKENGKITPVHRQPTGGKTPRYFTVTPDGRYVLIGHQNDDAITIFKRNRKTGKLTMTDKRISVPHAVCLKMIPIEK
ncbi:MAG TPA: lactonase family protein, partial [Chitinophagaceae bacterium]|nr:lactonase family protein [Chitinophagaceae bacterium]